MKTLLAVFCLALLATIDLEKRSLLEGKLQMLVPKEFRWMTAEELALKYGTAANAPKLVLSNDELNVNLGINHTTSKASEADMPQVRTLMKKQLESAYPSLEWKSDSIRTINGRKVIGLELITERTDKVYNYMLITRSDNRLLIVSFNCAYRLMKDWEPVASKMMNSVTTLDYQTQ